ncbi:hypothetical protein D6C89_06374 [Aureobasidium pullulans]|nr:hypothetical protein D6C89_06374 [Aureobasidium pullulans]
MADADEITTPAEAKHTLVKLVQELHRVLSALRGMDAPVHDFTLDAMQETIANQSLQQERQNHVVTQRDRDNANQQRDAAQTSLNAATQSLQQERTDHAVARRDLNTATDDHDAARASLGTVNQSLQDEQTQHGATRQALTDERLAHGNTTTTLTNAQQALNAERVAHHTTTNESAAKSTQIAVLQTQLDAATNALTSEQDRHIATTQASQVKDQLLLRDISGLLVTDALTRPRVTEDLVTNHQTDHATTTQDPAVERTAQGDPRAGDKRPQDSRDSRLSSPEQSRSALRTIFDHATTDNDAVTASDYVSPNDPSLRKGYVVIKVSIYALLHVSIVQDLSERRHQHGVQV